jgi:heterodisulfide reductase subunit A-like polyferredoxin
MFRNQNGSSLRPVEFTIAGVALAILASAAAPTQVPNQIAADEADAIEALRSIAAAQAEFKADVDIDTNCDGVGEYGYLAEMAGTRPMRWGWMRS